MGVQSGSMGVKHCSMGVQHCSMSVKHCSMGVQHCSMSVKHCSMSVQWGPVGVRSGSTFVPGVFKFQGCSSSMSVQWGTMSVQLGSMSVQWGSMDHISVVTRGESGVRTVGFGDSPPLLTYVHSYVEDIFADKKKLICWGFGGFPLCSPDCCCVFLTFGCSAWEFFISVFISLFSNIACNWRSELWCASGWCWCWGCGSVSSRRSSTPRRSPGWCSCSAPPSGRGCLSQSLESKHTRWIELISAVYGGVQRSSALSTPMMVVVYLHRKGQSWPEGSKLASRAFVVFKQFEYSLAAKQEHKVSYRCSLPSPL